MEKETREPRREKVAVSVIQFFSLVGLVIIIYFISNKTTFETNSSTVQKYKIEGYSMYTPYEEGDEILVHKNPKEYQRFDIVAFTQEYKGEEFTMIKRIIGLPSETVEYKGNVLYINGLETPQNFADSRFYLTEDFKDETSDNCVYVLGDNRRQSKDSRTFGCISVDNLIGVVLE